MRFKDLKIFQKNINLDKQTPALFLDRDGVLIKDNHYISDPKRVKLELGVMDLLRFAKKKGWITIVITNQSGIERGYFTLYEYTNLCRVIFEKFNEEGIDLEIRTCPHHPKRNCLCRKPNTGMFLDSRNHNDIMIGDQNSDMLAAKKSGIRHRWLISKTIKSDNATKTFESHKHLLEYLDVSY